MSEINNFKIEKGLRTASKLRTGLYSIQMSVAVAEDEEWQVKQQSSGLSESSFCRAVNGLYLRVARGARRQQPPPRRKAATRVRIAGKTA